MKIFVGKISLLSQCLVLLVFI